ncbi:MAG: hypothetical protein HY535_04265 [Chloroflexi bacterium]|nr:hypothetical protein [Chloroflexota bacterium]
MQALAAVGDEGPERLEEGIPEGLFGHIVGHDDVKHWVHKSLASPSQCTSCWWGPPATAKSMFLQALGSPAGEPVRPGLVQ